MTPGQLAKGIELQEHLKKLNQYKSEWERVTDENAAVMRDDYKSHRLPEGFIDMVEIRGIVLGRITQAIALVELQFNSL